MPRNLSKPDRSANFAVDTGSDERLTEWMDQHLRLATWAGPASAVLDEVETIVLKRLHPPLNLAKVGEPRDRLRAARAHMAASARNWTAEQGS